jgi:homoserine dehydrogenase
MSDRVRVALLGCGVVGADVVRLLSKQAGDLADRIGAPVELVGIAVRRLNRDRGPLPVPADLFTTDALGLVKREDVDIVIEVVGGVEPARGWLVEALRSGKGVVTANKALLAEDGAALHDAAADGDADLYYEASVAGAIPLLRPLRESLHGDRITRVTGIVNGTTNFILSNMDSSGTGFQEALEQATALGYAEPDPTADVEGFDAAAKAAILASLAFHSRVRAADVYREGITEVTAADVASAKAMGCTIKLLCIAAAEHGAVAVRVHPAMIPRSHPLASVGDAFNAVFVEADAAGQLMFYGRGAGGAPTASAVLGDVVAVARNRRERAGGRARPTRPDHNGPMVEAGPGGPAGGAGSARAVQPGRTGLANRAVLRIQPMGEVITRYHISLDVADRAGVLAVVASVFADHDVSIQTVRQQGRGADATLVVVTHSAPDAALAATVDELRGLDIVREVTSVMRVEGE